MEFEKTLFRVHERFLSSDIVKRGVGICFLLTLILSNRYHPSIPIRILSTKPATSLRICQHPV